MKSAILITVSLKSKRLKKKALKKIYGYELITLLIKRLKKSQFRKNIIICTSNKSFDDPLVSIAYKNEIKIYRGEFLDVLKRLTNAANSFELDFIINCTGDNPLIDIKYVNILKYKMERSNLDFIETYGLPWGSFSYGVRTSAMNKVCLLKKTYATEVWHDYFRKINNFSCYKILVKNKKYFYPDLRVTVDTIEDFNLVKKIFKHFLKNFDDYYFSTSQFIEFLNENKHLLNINSHIQQKKAPKIKF